MKGKKLGLSLNFFSSSKSKKFKDKYRVSDKISSSKALAPIQMGLMEIKKGLLRKKTERQSKRKKTNRIYKLYKKDKNRKTLEVIKKELEQKILGKYANPYMKNITHMISPFSKEKKILYYDYYRITYILQKKKCRLYCLYKDYKLIYDHQEYFFKCFTLKESKLYLNYLVYMIYSKDPFVKSNKLICLNKDLNKLKREYNEHIINNIFNAKRLILSRDLNKYLPDISNKLYEKSKDKLSRIAIPKYRLLLKPVIKKRINYLYVKDVPIIKIPKIVPNYSMQDKRIVLLIKSYFLKKKLSILLINGKRVPKKIKDRKSISRELSHDNDILNSVRGSDSEDLDTVTNSTLLYISKFFMNKNQNLNFRKKMSDITDIEGLIYTILLNTEEGRKAATDDNNNENLPSSYLDSLKNSKENDSEIFLSTLKKPFIGNREGKKIKHVKFKETKKKEINNKKRNDDLLLYTMDYLVNNKNKSNTINNKKFKLFLNLDEDEYNFFNDAKCVKNKDINNKLPKQDIMKKYFSERFINPRKYKEYLIKNPFIKTVSKISDSFNPLNISVMRNKHLKENKKSTSSFSSDKSNQPQFKATYKFLLDFNKKEKRDELINDLINKSNKIYNQIKTMSDAEQKRSHFKKSGPFAFTSFKGINFDKKYNEWDVTKSYFKQFYDKAFGNSILLKKINRENNKKEEYFKNCITLKQMLKSSNVYS